MLKRSTIKYCSMMLAFILVSGSPLSLAQELMNQKGNAKNATDQKSNAKNLTEEQKVYHLLDRITFGSRPGDIERVMKMGWKKFLEDQLHPERNLDTLVEEKLKNIESLRLSNGQLAQNYQRPKVIIETLKKRGVELNAPATNNQQGAAPQPNDEKIKKRREAMMVMIKMDLKPQQQLAQELQQAKIIRAVYSEKQLQEVMTDFWFNHFNVYIQKGPVRFLATSYERDVIRPRVFGKFEDLLRATAESPAMLFYLDNWMSVSPNAKMPTQNLDNRDELRQMRRERQLGNPGRVRVLKLDPLNGGQNPNGRTQGQAQQQILNNKGQIPKRTTRGLNENYAREIMELHTLGVDGGYTQKDVQEVARCFTGWTIQNPRGGGDFIFNPYMHDDGDKIVLGQKIPAGGGKQDGDTVIRILAHHPSTAKFISTKLARKFVSDNPPQSLVDRMAQTFLKTDGDMSEVLRALFNSPEFWAPENYRAKIKTPFEMTTSAARAIGAETNGNPAFHRWIAQMGEGLFMAQPPTGYPDSSEHWVNTGALLERMNFALALSSNRIQGTRVNLESLAPSVTTEQSAQIVDRYVKLLLRGEMSPQSRATIDKALNEQENASAGSNPTNTDVAGVAKIDKLAKIVGLILGSPEFQRQ
ncbi:MAG: DUF1800 domain-containing protein [Acidobacteria bacterium]|nr:DUF1800 domain-containing protein [Acidobacteriota bacterium]